MRIGLSDPELAVVLSEVVSKEPLGPVVRQGDDQWANIVRWSLMVMIEAEFLLIDSATVDTIKIDGHIEQKRLLGVENEVGERLSLSSEWAYNIVKQVGNYGESFERNLGSGSSLNIAHGLNAQCNRGGILYSISIR